MALELYYEGSDFLYGALFRICFPYYNNHWDNTNPNHNNLNSDKKKKKHLPATKSKVNHESSDVVSFVFLSVPGETTSPEQKKNANDDENDSNNDMMNIDAGIKCLRQMLPLSDDPNT